MTDRTMLQQLCDLGVLKTVGDGRKLQRRLGLRVNDKLEVGDRTFHDPIKKVEIDNRTVFKG